jgi:hypothetical protein
MKSRVTLLLLLISLTSCSYLTKTGRQEMAYRKYIRKSSVVRTKQQKKFHFRVPQMDIRQNSPTMISAPESPQSVTSSQEAEQAGGSAPAVADQGSSPN